MKRFGIGTRVSVHRCSLAAAVGLLTLFIGCGAALKLKTTVSTSPYDVPMFGKSSYREFTDTSAFSFPLALKWEYDASAGFGNGSPIVVGNTLIMGTLQGELHAVDIVTGKRIKYIKNFSPIASSPAVYKRYVIFGLESAANNLISIDTEDGEVRWTRNIGGVASSPLIIHDRLYTAGLDGKFYCLEAEYGTTVWSADTRAPIRSSPCGDNDRVYCANTNGDVSAFDRKTGERQWTFSVRNAVFAGLTVSGGKLFVGSRDSSLYILDAVSGALAVRIPVGNKIMSAPAVQNGTVYVTSLDGALTAFNVSDGTMRWRFQARGAINTTPVITQNAIVTASLDRFVYAVSPADGSLLWKHDMDSRIKTTPLVWKNSIIIAAEDKNIYCFR